MQELQQIVARTSDHLGLHATAPSLVLGLQARLGALAADVEAASERGRRPFRGSRDWEPLLGELAFALLNLADQTGVDLDRAVRVTADRLYRAGLAQQPRAEAGGGDAWPFSS